VVRRRDAAQRVARPACRLSGQYDFLLEVAFAGTGDQSEHAAPESHAVRDSLVAGANKVGDSLKSGAQKVGPSIDHGLATAKKAVEKSANAVGTALKETGNKIEQKVSSKSGGDKPVGSTPK
jgi:hypothetical protein